MLEPAQSEAILESVRATLAGSGFLFSREWAKVIDGTGLELPAGDELLGPVALGMIGFVIVMVLARIGKRLER